MERRITFIVPSEPESLSLVGPLIHGLCRDLSCSKEDCGRMETCVVEAVNNCYLHAYRGARGKSIEVSIRVTDQEIRFDVSDEGERMDVRKLETEGSAEGLAAGGRGLVIIRKWMDRVRYASRDGRNVLTMIRERGGPRGA